MAKKEPYYKDKALTYPISFCISLCFIPKEQGGGLGSTQNRCPTLSYFLQLDDESYSFHPIVPPNGHQAFETGLKGRFVIFKPDIHKEEKDLGLHCCCCCCCCRRHRCYSCLKSLLVFIAHPNLYFPIHPNTFFVASYHHPHSTNE